MTPFTLIDCAAGNERNIRVVVTDRDVTVARQVQGAWPQPIARLQPSVAVQLAVEILRRHDPYKLRGE